MSYIYSPYEEQIWNALSAFIGNDYGVAGLMGNLYAESGLIPGRVENDFTSGYTVSQEYTDKLNNGQVTREEFRWNTIPPQIAGGSPQYGPGYGLAQWTYYTRKYNYYDYFTAGQHGQAGSVQFDTWFLIWELQTDFSSVYNVLVSATSVRQASDKVLHDFENPEQQGTAVEVVRAQYGQNLYNQYHGTGPTPPVPPTPRRKLPIIFYLRNPI